MWIFSSFALEAKCAMRIYPHPMWERLKISKVTSLYTTLATNFTDYL